MLTAARTANIELARSLLECCEDEQQKAKMRAVIDHNGNLSAASRSLGLSKNAIPNTLRALESRAARMGKSDPAGWNYGVPKDTPLKACQTCGQTRKESRYGTR
jgi:hypothetical protein